MKNDKLPKTLSRRKFIGKSTVALTAFTVVPRLVPGSSGYTAQSDKQNMIEIDNRGLPVIKLGKESHPPYMLYVNTQEQWKDRFHLIYEQIEKARDQCFNIISFATRYDHSGSYQELDGIVNKILELNPDARFIPRIGLGVLDGQWVKEHLDHIVTKHNGDKVGNMMSITSDAWAEKSKESLRVLVEHIESSSYSKNIVGYHLGYYATGEWQDDARPVGTFTDYSLPSRLGFRQWVQSRYKDQAALESVWGTSEVEIPTAEQRLAKAFLLDPSLPEHQQIIDYHVFHNFVYQKRVNEFYSFVKEVSKINPITVVFFGYLNEHAYLRSRSATSGHIFYNEVLRFNSVDSFASPYSYNGRGIGEPIVFHSPLDSAMPRGKIWFVEDDTYTHLSMKPAEGVVAPGYNVRTENMKETIEVLKRNFGACYTRNAGLWWMDLLADGRYNDKAIWSLNRKLVDIYRATPEGIDLVYRPEIAVLYDGEALLYLGKEADNFIWHSFGATRHDAIQTGTTVGYYSLRDVDYIPDGPKVFLVVNPLSLSDRQIEAINKKLKRNGNVIVWLYAAGYVTESGFDIARMSGLMEIEIARGEGCCELNSVINTVHLAFSQFNGQEFGLENPAAAIHFHSVDQRALTIGSVRNRPNFVLKEFPDWTSVYVCAPRLPYWAIRPLVNLAGGHLFLEESDGTDYVYANPHSVFLHTQKGGDKTINLKEAKDVYKWEDGESRLMGSGVSRFKDSLQPKSTAVYILK